MSAALQWVTPPVILGDTLHFTLPNGQGWISIAEIANLTQTLESLTAANLWEKSAQTKQLASLLLKLGILSKAEPKTCQKINVTIIGNGDLATELQRQLHHSPVNSVQRIPLSSIGRRHQNHWVDLRPDNCDLAILASEYAEADRGVVSALFRKKIMHLPLIARAQEVLIGPLVQPLETTCVACVDQQKTLTNPDWPKILLALSKQLAHPSPQAIGYACSWVIREISNIAQQATSSLIGQTGYWNEHDSVEVWRQWRGQHFQPAAAKNNHWCLTYLAS